MSPEADLQRKKAVQAAFLGIIIVGLLLGFNGYRTLEIDRDNTIAWRATESWLQGTPYVVTGVVMTYSPGDFAVTGPANVTVSVAGTGPLPDVGALAALMEEHLRYKVNLQIRSSPEEILYYPASSPPGS